MEYLRRSLDDELDLLLAHAPAVALDGPKGVGKTATAQRRAAHTWQLDDPAQARVIEADFALTTLPEGTILFDEWQHTPRVWDAVRRQVDAGAPPGRFLLTGSASPTNPGGSHSGAGRILSVRIRPMGLHERGRTTPAVSFAALLAGDFDSISGHSDFTLPDYFEAITESGFPAILRADARVRRHYIDAYLERIIDRDIPDIGGGVRRPETLRRWMAAYGAASSTTTSYSKILDATTGGDGSQPAKTTTITYRDWLHKLWILDEVPAWLPAGSPLKTLGQAPKHQLADPALAARLLGITSTNLTHAKAHFAGPLFESLVTLGVRAMAQTVEARVSHLRLQGGTHEVDLIVEGPEDEILALEVKLASEITDTDVAHLHWLRSNLPDRAVHCAVINTGQYAYVRRDGIAVIPLSCLGL